VLVRGDGSTAHEGIFDTILANFCARPPTRAIAAIPAGRAPRLALYGSPLVRVQPRPAFLDTAQACAEYTSPRAGRWRSAVGFQRARENRTLLDTSSAAIAAAGLLRLCRLAPDSMKGIFTGRPRCRSCGRYAKSTWPKPTRMGRDPQRRRLFTSIKDWAWTSRYVGRILLVEPWNASCGKPSEIRIRRMIGWLGLKARAEIRTRFIGEKMTHRIKLLLLASSSGGIRQRRIHHLYGLCDRQRTLGGTAFTNSLIT